MPYYVTKSDGTAIVVLDGTKDTTSTSLTLFGRLVTNYGDETNENFVRLLENFSNSTEPAFPITGQLFFDRANTSLKVYTLANTWIPVGSVIQGNVDISGNLELGASGFKINDTGGNIQITNSTNFANISFFSNVSGTSTRVLHLNGINGLVEISGNATSNLGVVSKIYVDSLHNIAIANLGLRTSNIQTINANIGSYQTFANSNAASQTNQINQLNANLSSYQTYANASLSALSNSINAVVSGTGSIDATSISVNGNVVIDNSALPVGNTTVNFHTPGGTSFISAYGSNVNNTTVIARGQWSLDLNSYLTATYADLAEYYESDNEYQSGTVVVFGGKKEVTISTKKDDSRVAGIVTTNPAYVMNSQQTGTRVCIALAGRVPCRVIGTVEQGDLLTTSEIPGCAQKASLPVIGSIIGKAIENKDYEHEGIIEVFVAKV